MQLYMSINLLLLLQLVDHPGLLGRGLIVRHWPTYHCVDIYAYFVHLVHGFNQCVRLCRFR